MQITLRPAIAEDFAYCKRLYFPEMKRIIEELNLDPAAQEVGFEQQWELVQVRIIMLNGSEVGWLQSVMQGEGLFIGQLFVDGPFQRRGIGTRVIKGLVGEAARVSQAVLLNVVKTNPALRLYKRLGIYITHEDSRKFYLKRDCDSPSPAQTK
jgi:ribosomal protein S18 acetylase RimI-like enzyme